MCPNIKTANIQNKIETNIDVIEKDFELKLNESLKQLNQQLKNQDNKLIKKLKKADELFTEVRLLQEKLPNCKIIY